MQPYAPQKIQLIMLLRQLGISSTDVLSAIETIPREDFVLSPFKDKAYENIALPIGLGQTISQPFIVAKMTTALELNKKARVLEIGTGSGYQTLVLAKLCRRVYTVERHKSLLQEAEKRFKKYAIHNISTRHGDGWKGWPEQKPIDRILVTAAADTVPEDLLKQLSPNGIMIIPIGKLEQKLMKIKKNLNNEIEMEELLDVKFVPLVTGKGSS